MKGKKKRIAAAALAGALAFAAIPMDFTEAKADGNDGMTAHYDMSHTGNQLLDVSQNGRNASLSDTADADFTSYGSAHVLQFKNKQYASLPKGLVTKDDNDFTVEMTVAAQTKAAHWAWCLGTGDGTWGENTGDYVFVNPISAEGNYSGKVLSGIKVGVVSSGAEKRLPAAAKGLDAGYSTVSLVSNGKTLTLYEDGQKLSEVDHDYNLETVIPDGDVIGYIGKSLFKPDEKLTANMSDIKFWDKALSVAEIQSGLPSVDKKADMLAADIKKELGDKNGSLDSITFDMTLPAVIDGVDVTWESENKDVITDKGAVSAPDEETKVNLKATYPVDGRAMTRAFEVTVKAEEPQKGELTAHYDMSHKKDTLKDISGNNNDATLHETEESDFVSADGEDVLQFNNKQYASLPLGLIENNNFTIQTTLSSRTNAAHWLFAIGNQEGTWNENNVGNYVFVNPTAAEWGGKVLSGIKIGKNGSEVRVPKSSEGNDLNDIPGYGTITLVSRDGRIDVYVDSRKISSVNHNYSMSDIIPTEGVLGYIGKSLFTQDAYLTANVSDMKVWNKALTAAEVKENLPSADEKLKMLTADLAGLKDIVLNGNKEDAVESNLSFPGSIDGVDLTWTTNDEAVIGTDGTVTQPVGKSKKVEITAAYTYGGQELSQKFTVTVKELDVDETLKAAADALDIPEKDSICGNITLPQELEKGVKVSWETDRDDIVDVNSHKAEAEGYDEIPAGLVTRPASDTVVKMTAALSLGDKKVKKEIKIKVKAAPKASEESDYTDYFFAYFAGEGHSDGEQIYFASSEDGLNWTDLNANKPVLTSELGEKGVRDPFILRSPEGDKFYMIATDLKIHGNGDWNGAQNNGSQSLMIWESTDLVNWSDQRMAEVSASIGAGCTWAPEATYDDVTGEYVVYWASRTPAVDGKQRLYYAKTRDFYTFTEPKLYIEKDESSIDTTMIEYNGTYYRYTKNEGGKTNELGANTKSIFIEKSNNVLGTFESIKSDSLNSNQWVEGPAIFKLNEDDAKEDTWCLLVDNFGGGGYYPLVTNDLESGEFTKPVKYKMPSRARHGTPIRVTKAEYNRVMQQWGGQAVDNTELKDAVDAENNSGLEEAEYTKDSWKAYETARMEAESVLANSNATAAEISHAFNNLRSARAALVPANRSDLEESVSKEQEKNLDGGKYTQESWNAYQNALNSAQEILKNSASTPDEIKAAMDALADAAKALEKKADDAGNTDDNQKPSGDTKPDDGKGDGANNGGQGNAPKNAGRAAKTGDTTPVAALTVLLILAAGGIVYGVKRKRTSI